PLRQAPEHRRSPHAEIKALVEQYLGSTRRVGQGIAPVRTHRFEDVLVRHERSSCRGYPTCCATAKASCLATSPSPPRRRTCSATESRTSPATCASYSGRGLLRASSGTGPATPKWCSPASAAERGISDIPERSRSPASCR